MLISELCDSELCGFRLPGELAPFTANIGILPETTPTVGGGLESLGSLGSGPTLRAGALAIDGGGPLLKSGSGAKTSSFPPRSEYFVLVGGVPVSKSGRAWKIASLPPGYLSATVDVDSRKSYIFAWPMRVGSGGVFFPKNAFTLLVKDGLVATARGGLILGVGGNCFAPGAIGRGAIGLAGCLAGGTDCASSTDANAQTITVNTTKTTDREANVNLFIDCTQ